MEFFGEYECKIDAKGRLRLPTSLVKKLGELTTSPFIINRGFEKHLNIHPQSEWTKVTKDINQLNMYEKKNRSFARYFFRGASEVELDAQERILLPSALLEYAGIEKEVVLSAFSNKIEIWDKSLFETMLDDEPEHFAELAEVVMGKSGDDETKHYE